MRRHRDGSPEPATAATAGSTNSDIPRTSGHGHVGSRTPVVDGTRQRRASTRSTPAARNVPEISNPLVTADWSQSGTLPPAAANAAPAAAPNARACRRKTIRVIQRSESRRRSRTVRRNSTLWRTIGRRPPAVQAGAFRYNEAGPSLVSSVWPPGPCRPSRCSRRPILRTARPYQPRTLGPARPRPTWLHGPESRPGHARAGPR